MNKEINQEKKTMMDPEAGNSTKERSCELPG